MAFGCKDDKLLIKEIIDGKENIVGEISISVSSPYLKIEVNEGTQCSFLWSKDGKKWNLVDGITPKRDYSKQVRWDRVARPGLIHCGVQEQPAEFSYFSCY